MEISSAVCASLMLVLLISSPAMARTPPSPSLPIHTPPSPSLPISPAPAPAPNHVNLTQLLTLAGPFSTFLNYLLQTQVIQTFQNQANNTDQGVTIFVPLNSAFASLKQSTFSKLTQDQLKSLLLYHGLPKYYSISDFNDLSNLNPVTTFAGGKYTLNFTDNMGLIRVASRWSNPKITSSVYSSAPVAVYEVDKVLLPLEIFSSDPPLAPAQAPDAEVKPSDRNPSADETVLAPESPASASCCITVGLVNYLALACFGFLMLVL